MIDNYPPGAANDPNAPWNKKDPVMTEWEECEHSPDDQEWCLVCEETLPLNENFICEKCFEPEEVEDDE